MLEEQSGEWPVYLGVDDVFVCMSSSRTSSLFFNKVRIKNRVGRQIGTCLSV